MGENINLQTAAINVAELAGYDKLSTALQEIVISDLAHLAMCYAEQDRNGSIVRVNYN